MKKKFFFLIIAAMIAFSANSENLKDIYFKNLFYNLYNCIDIFSKDYSQITGLYTANGAVKGSATIGNFPSFRIGTSAGVIFFTNPIRFLKNISYSNRNWEDIRHDYNFRNARSSMEWFDTYYLPIPVTNYYFEIGLPKGMSVGSNFFISNYGDFVNAARPDASTYLKHLVLWGIGANFNYTILKEYKYFPSISFGTGVNYSDSNFTLDNYAVGNTSLDSSNKNIPTYLGFNSHSYNTSFSFELTISKEIFFFQPFLNCKFVQSVTYNESKFLVRLDLANATQSAKDIYQDGKYEITNLKIRYNSTYPIGDILPTSDFILNAGFEFIIKIFRMGFQSSYSIVSQKGMILLDMRFHLEDWQLKKNK